MKRKQLVRKLSAAAVCGLFLLSGGCSKDRRHYERVEQDALTYYREKYGENDAEIVDGWKAGNSGLFGYVGVADRAYEMSDGYTVYWDDEAGTFADDRQAPEIREAFDREVFQPLVRTLPAPFSFSEYALNRTNYESYDACVFRTYFDGDIRAFLESEQPSLSGLYITLEETEGFDHEAWTDTFYAFLDPYVSGYADVVVKRTGTGTEGDAVPGLDDPDLLSKAYLRFGDSIHWYRQVYIEVLDGVYVTSDQADFVLEAGDVRFEEAGTCAEVQRILDEAYEALPVDAEENKSGGYRVHDQRHESRTILSDLNAPYYRLVLSQRVMEELDSGDRLSVYIRTERSDLPLMVYYGYGYSGWDAFTVCSETDIAEYHTLHPDNLYWFGPVQHQPYEES
ncbi:MAG: hypothetical protein IKF51_06735 [Solobacterium sp.]|nr:hypothetical protein [Solobacterium sp.]